VIGYAVILRSWPRLVKDGGPFTGANGRPALVRRRRKA
jgi:hypothetical protein